MYSLWRSIKRIMSKIILKCLTWILLIFLTVFSSVFKIALFIFRRTAFPCGIIAVVAAFYYYFESGLCREFYWLVTGIFVGIVAYFTLPKATPLLDSLKERVTYCAYEPIFVRSPVKYTM